VDPSFDPVVPQGYQVLAHGIGGARDLPIPLPLTISAAVAALTISFTVLALAWRTPRFEDASDRPAPTWLTAIADSTALRLALRALGFAVFGFSLAAAVFGKDTLINPFFGLFYVVLWVGIVPLSVAFGSFYKSVSPVRTLHALFAKVSGSDPGSGLLDYPAWLGRWPAALGLFAFVWLELVYPNSNMLGSVRLWFAAYVAVMIVGGALFGDRFFENADPFEVYSTLAGHLSFFARRDGRLVLISPMAHLGQVTPTPGLVAVVGVLFGSTAFDSFKDSTVWLTRTQSWDVSPLLLNNLALLVFCLAVMLLFALATVLTGVHDGQQRWLLPRHYAHSIMPIVVGYITAHYLTYLVSESQQTLIQASDPLSTGANWFGTANWQVNYWLSYHSQLVADIKVAGVVIGHVLGVVAAHDRAIALLPKRHQLTGQLPLLFVMVGFTISGLYLLFAA
jgi:hypothetical protein